MPQGIDLKQRAREGWQTSTPCSLDGRREASNYDAWKAANFLPLGYQIQDGELWPCEGSQPLALRTQGAGQ